MSETTTITVRGDLRALLRIRHRGRALPLAGVTAVDVDLHPGEGLR